MRKKYCLKDKLGFVNLVQETGDDLSIVNSARVSFGKRIEQIEDKDRKLIKYLLEHKHGTPFEHNSLTFHVKAPIFIARQWFRHRIASFNEISGRYVKLKDEFYVPQEFREQSKNNRQASIQSNQLDHSKLSELYQRSSREAYQNYQRLLELGVAREQARGLLPLNTYTEFYFTCNLRAFLHFIDLRDHQGAQWEIRQYAKTMLEQVQKVFPETIKIWEELKSKTQ